MRGGGRRANAEKTQIGVTHASRRKSPLVGKGTDPAATARSPRVGRGIVWPPISRGVGNKGLGSTPQKDQAL